MDTHSVAFSRPNVSRTVAFVVLLRQYPNGVIEFWRVLRIEEYELHTLTLEEICYEPAMCTTLVTFSSLPSFAELDDPDNFSTSDEDVSFDALADEITYSLLERTGEGCKRISSNSPSHTSSSSSAAAAVTLRAVIGLSQAASLAIVRSSTLAERVLDALSAEHFTLEQSAVSRARAADHGVREGLSTLPHKDAKKSLGTSVSHDRC